jgi:putative transposase
MTWQVKRAFKYRFHPTDEQAAELSRTFGCVRLVYNKALEERTRAWYGRELVVIDRWFPSSKLCGDCGTVCEKLPLGVLAWRCVCGAVHDRDVNAARNILAAGLAASACGDGVRPQRESSRTGRSSVKQETQRATAGISRP